MPTFADYVKASLFFAGGMLLDALLETVGTDILDVGCDGTGLGQKSCEYGYQTIDWWPFILLVGIFIYLLHRSVVINRSGI